MLNHSNAVVILVTVLNVKSPAATYDALKILAALCVAEESRYCVQVISSLQYTARGH